MHWGSKAAFCSSPSQSTQAVRTARRELFVAAVPLTCSYDGILRQLLCIKLLFKLTNTLLEVGAILVMRQVCDDGALISIKLPYFITDGIEVPSYCCRFSTPAGFYSRQVWCKSWSSIVQPVCTSVCTDACLRCSKLMRSAGQLSPK